VQLKGGRSDNREGDRNVVRKNVVFHEVLPANAVLLAVKYQRSGEGCARFRHLKVADFELLVYLVIFLVFVLN
jgi:hypothetical protein